jgi:hypothetical protein
MRTVRNIVVGPEIYRQTRRIAARTPGHQSRSGKKR